jgi:integrase/recombinase XerD
VNTTTPVNIEKIGSVHQKQKNAQGGYSLIKLWTLDFTTINLFTNYLHTLGYSKRSIAGLPNHVAEFFFQLKKKKIEDIQNITPQRLQEHFIYLQERPNIRRGGTLSSSSIKAHIYAIRLFFHWQQLSGAITINPVSGLVFQTSAPNQKEILTQDEIKQLYEACQTLKDKALLGIFYGCGLRRTEAEQLDIRDIHFTKQLLYVREGKGKKRRVIPMSKTITQDLQNYYVHERGMLLSTAKEWGEVAFMINKRGGRMKGERCYQRIKELLQLTNNEELKTKGIGLHSLRHSIASHLLENGLTVEYIRDFLGHEFLETTQIYTRVTKKQLTINF